MSFTQTGKKWQVGIDTSVEYNTVTYTGKKDLFTAVLDKKWEKPQWNYSLGLNLNYRFNNQLGLSSGLSYTKRSSKTVSSVESFKIDEIYNFLEIPFQVNYWFNHGKISFFVGAGFRLSYLFNSRIHAIASGQYLKVNTFKYLINTSNNPVIPIN